MALALDAQKTSGAKSVGNEGLGNERAEAKMLTATNDKARVHPAQPSHSVVVPAPELLSINVAVAANIAMIERFRKGLEPAARPIGELPARPGPL